MNDKKPILTVRPKEGVESLIRRGKNKLVPDLRADFERSLAMFDDPMLVIESFFDLEYKQ